MHILYLYIFDEQFKKCFCSIICVHCVNSLIWSVERLVDEELVLCVVWFMKQWTLSPQYTARELINWNQLAQTSVGNTVSHAFAMSKCCTRDCCFSICLGYDLWCGILFQGIEAHSLTVKYEECLWSN